MKRLFPLSFLLITTTAISLELEEIKRYSLLQRAQQITTTWEKSSVSYPYAKPRPEKALQLASNWLILSPSSLLLPEGVSLFSYLSQESLSKMLHSLGIEGIEIPSLQLSAEVKQGHIYSSKKGDYAPISYQLDPRFGSYEEYLSLVEAAHKEKITLLGSIFPGYTGKGFDFWLAIRNYQDYPNLYHLIEISPSDWDLLPPIPKDKDCAPLSFPTLRLLQERGYLPSIWPFFSAKKLKWSATSPVLGYEGKEKRWIYLQAHTENQPILKAFDASFAAQRILSAGILASLYYQKTPFLRISSFPYTLGNFSPIAELFAQLIRKSGGYSFLDINTNIFQLHTYLTYGSEFCYDFLLKSAFLHSLLHQNKELLSSLYEELLQQNFPLGRLIHSLESQRPFHYDWVDFLDQPEQPIFFRGKKRRKKEVRSMIYREDIPLLTQKYPYNPYEEGVFSSPLLGMLAACLKVEDLSSLTPPQKQALQKVHFLFAFFSAMQPGIFSFSLEDLVGLLPIPSSISPTVKPWQKDIKDISLSLSFTSTLYPPLLLQLKDPHSFIRQLQKLLQIRKTYHISQAKMKKLLPLKNSYLFAYFLQLPTAEDQILVVMNLSPQSQKEKICLEEQRGNVFFDLFTQKPEKKAPFTSFLELEIAPHEGKAFFIKSKYPS